MGSGGKKVFGRSTFGCRTTVTMIGAIAMDGIRSLVNIESITTNEVFRAFVQQHIVQSLRRGDFVVMDNLSAHKDKMALEAIRRAGAIVLFLPPYSPNRMPIEKFWAKIKRFARRLLIDTRAKFDSANDLAMRTISSDSCIGWIKHCGYTIRSN